MPAAGGDTMKTMVRVSVLLALLLASAVVLGQALATLRVNVVLPDAGGAAVPVARHALLISENPPSREPRRVVTSADGTLAVSLAPGSYIVESDRAVALGGRAYQWTAVVDVVAGQDTVLTLNAQNAEQVPLSDAAARSDAPAPAPDPDDMIAKWQASVVTIWSPTAKASGFVVDATGLVVTDRAAIGSATSVEVQVSRTSKVPGHVLAADAKRSVAVVWVDPSVLAEAAPVPLTCPSSSAKSPGMGDEIVALAASLEGEDRQRGEVTGFHPRGIETDLRLAFGDVGGPVFAADGANVVGLTVLQNDENAARMGDVLVARAGIVCEAIAAARSQTAGGSPPAPTPLPVEPARAFAADVMASLGAGPSSSTPPMVSSPNFDVAFITPRTVVEARQRADRTGGRSTRPAEAEALLGRLTDFGPLTDYFTKAPGLLVVRVTPKMVEGFWKRLAREAARTQGAVLPAFKDFKTNFLRLQVTCGANDVTPIHPFVLEHSVAEKRVVREGLYAFSADAMGPHCGTVTLTLSSDATPAKPDTITVDAKTISQIWEDTAPFR